MANIDFFDAQGNSISRAELEQSDGRFDFETYLLENVSEEAQELHTKARELAQQGDYFKCIQTLERARAEAPTWPYPVYDIAYAYLLLDNYSKALEYYTLVDELAPRGFYTSKLALYTLQKEDKGEYQAGTYKAFISLESIDDQMRKLSLLKMFTDKMPNFAPAWLHYAQLVDGEEHIAALENGLMLETDTDTRGSLVIGRALYHDHQESIDNTAKVLLQLIFDEKTTLANVEKAKFVLFHLSANA